MKILAGKSLGWRLAELRRQIDELKAAQARPTHSPSPEEIARYKDSVHQARERAANSFRFSPEIQRKMDAACDVATAHDLAMHGTVKSQSQAGASGFVAGVRSFGRVAPGLGTGWKEAALLRPPPGVELSDRLMDRQDDIDMAKRVEEESKLRALQKAAGRLR